MSRLQSQDTRRDNSRLLLQLSLYGNGSSSDKKLKEPAAQYGKQALFLRFHSIVDGASFSGFHKPVGQLYIMPVQDSEPVDIVRLPRLLLAAEMKDHRMFHNPIQVVLSPAAYQILPINVGKDNMLKLF